LQAENLIIVTVYHNIRGGGGDVSEGRRAGNCLLVSWQARSAVSGDVTAPAAQIVGHVLVSQFLRLNKKEHYLSLDLWVDFPVLKVKNRQVTAVVHNTP
jgi:hypothetical protein